MRAPIRLSEGSKQTKDMTSFRYFFQCAVLISLLAMSCNDDNIGAPVFSSEFIFADSTGWTIDFADYPPGDPDLYEFKAAFTTLPEPLDTTRPALLISGANRSDDLFMYAKRKLTGLPPRQRLAVMVEATFASNAASNAVGIGGPPGESVYLKTGVTTVEPTTAPDEMGWLRLNIDKGNQSQIGSDALSLGNAANGTDEFVYVLLERETEGRLIVEPDENGEAWFYIGSDSGFEGTTSLYYHRVKITLRPVE